MHPLDDKIATLEQELSVVHNEEQRVPTLCDLVSTYDKRFWNTKNVSDRQTATIYGYEAIASIPKHDFRRPQLFTALISMQHDVIFGNSIGPDLGELEEAISFSEDALELINHRHGAAEQVQVLMCLSDFLHARFHLSDADDAINDLNKSIALAQTALQTQPGNPRISCLVVRRLLKRHSVVGDYWDAELAVRYSEDASMADPENPRLLETVSDALQARHLSTKSHRDLDEAISRLETALALPDLHAQHRLTLLEKLEVAKELHEARIGEGIGQSTEDLTAAIAQLSVEVSQSTPSGLSLLRSLTKLANICLLKASRTQDPNDLEIAYEYTSQTLQRTPRSHPQFAILIVKLGKIWMERGNLTRDPEFQEKCRAEAHNAFLHAAKQPSQPPLERVECFRAVAELAMERGEWDHPSWCLQRAMEMLPLVAWHTLLPEDLEFVLRRVSGIAALGAASFLTGGHACAHNALAQVELGRGMIFSLITGIRMDVSSLREKDPGTYAEYVSLRGTSAISKPIKVVTMDDIRAAIEAAGIHLPQGSGGSWQLENTSGVQRPQGLPSTAVALPPPTTSSEGRTEIAALEARPERYSTALDTTQPLTDQRRTHVRSDLRVTQDEDGRIKVEILPDDGSQPQTELQGSYPGLAASIHHEFATQLSKLEDRIRHTEGFDGFKQRCSLEYFKEVAKAGPIVSFNITPLRSDAFIVTKDSVTAIKFDPGILGYDVVQEKAKLISGPGSVLAQRPNGPTDIERNRKLRDVLKWLWDAAVKPVLQELSFMQSERGASAAVLPHIWWVTSGILGHFPFHAAGQKWHNSLQNTMSHVISSYIPTVRALEYAREKLACTSESGPGKAVIVAMPKTSGLPDLSIGPEIALIEQLSGCERMSYPQKADVLHELKNSNLVHFGCHGDADALHPRKSFLYVADGEDNRPERVTVEDLIKIDLPNAQLAYLSACSTAQNKVAELSEGLGGKQGGCKVLQTCC